MKSGFCWSEGQFRSDFDSHLITPSSSEVGDTSSLISFTMLSLAVLRSSGRLQVTHKPSKAATSSTSFTARLSSSSAAYRPQSTSIFKTKLYSRHIHTSKLALSQPNDQNDTFRGAGEFKRLVPRNADKIDESGNLSTSEGLSMPTQSSGGLTKRNNSDISELDIFEGEGAVITAYSESGFVLNEEYTEGAVLAFPQRFWSWSPQTLDEITIESLAPIWLHNPVPRTSLP